MSIYRRIAGVRAVDICGVLCGVETWEIVSWFDRCLRVYVSSFFGDLSVGIRCTAIAAWRSVYIGFNVFLVTMYMYTRLLPDLP